MFALRFAAWGAFGFAALALVLLINEGFIPYLGAALSLALAGVLLLAADKALMLLAGIRDALLKSEEPKQLVVDAGLPQMPPRSAADITIDIERLKNRH